MRLVAKYKTGNKTKYATAAKDVNTGETYDVYLQDGNTYDKDGNPVSVIGIPDTVITPQTYNQYLAAGSFDSKEKGLEGVYPEFDIITGAGTLKDIGSLGFKLAKNRLSTLGTKIPSALSQEISLNSPEAVNYSLDMVRKSPNFKETVPFYTRQPNYNYANVLHHGTLEANDFQKMWGKEIARRAEAMGNNMNDIQPMMVEGNFVVGTPYKLIQNQVSKPINIVSSTEIPDNVAGWHSGPDINIRLLGHETPQNIVSTQLHETAQHGTDDIISALPKSAVNTYYQPFLDKMSNFTFNTPTSQRWKELRATVGEHAAQLYKVLNRELGNAIRKNGSLTDYTNVFNNAVDKMSDQALLEQLSRLNAYGQDYARFLTQNPQYIKEYKSLLKYAPSVVATTGLSLPILTTQENK